MTTQRRHHATISGEDLYRRVIETAQSGKRLPAGALLTADNYSDFISSMTNARGVDDNTAAALLRYEAVSVAGLSTSDGSCRTTVDEMVKAEGLISATKRLYVEELEYINSEARRTCPQK